jgi:hypothetical protein
MKLCDLLRGVSPVDGLPVCAERWQINGYKERSRGATN